MNMILGTVSEDGSVLFTWTNNTEKNAMKNLLYTFEKSKFFDDYVIIEELRLEVKKV